MSETLDRVIRRFGLEKQFVEPAVAVTLAPAMSGPEVDLLQSLLRSAENYVEFGGGGSTVLASNCVTGRITCVDSSRDWLSNVEAHCGPNTPRTFLADIGPLKDWGWPADDTKKADWPNYHEAIWAAMPDVVDADTFLIDGRFRIACFLQVLLRASGNPLVAIHDFQRGAYSVVREFAAEICHKDRLYVFRRRKALDAQRLASVLAEHRLDPQ